jgi:hypothetical protein
MAEEDEEEYGPRFEVWNHLWSGLDMAQMEMDVLEDKSRAMTEKFGKLLVDIRAQLTLESGTFKAGFLDLDKDFLADAWVRHAAEIELAQDAISRATKALDRYFKLQPVITKKALPERAAKYLAEVVHTYAYGFDVACIALCRATLEQVLKDELIERGVYTAPQVRRERPTAGALLHNAKRADLLVTSLGSAEGIVKKGDTVLHDFIYDSKVVAQQAVDSITELLDVLVEILGSPEPPSSSD